MSLRVIAIRQPGRTMPAPARLLGQQWDPATRALRRVRGGTLDLGAAGEFGDPALGPGAVDEALEAVGERAGAGVSYDSGHDG
jgi:hypothetical protein